MEIRELKEDFINVSRTRAISSEGEVFELGDKVMHEGVPENQIGTVSSFFLDKETNDVLAETEFGYGRISFMYKELNS
jgi:hypothetical protein